MRRILLLSLILVSFGSYAQENVILSMKERSRVIDQLLENRIETVLPRIMRENDLDMWVIISREYNEDPVIKTFLPSTWISARRRNYADYLRSG